MERKNYLISGLVGLFIIAGAWFYVKGEVEFSIYKLRSAIVSHDSETALNYIDVDSLVDNTFARSMEELNDEAPASTWEAAGRNIGVGLAMMMKPALKDAFKSALKKAISEPDKDEKRYGIRNIKFLRFGFYSVKRNGASAVISLKKDPDLKFKFTKAATGYWKLTDIEDEAENNRRIARVQLKMLGMALSAYLLDNGKYPQSLDGLQKNEGLPSWDGPYLQKGVPNDPWDHPFYYKKIRDTAFVLASFGKDGIEGGDGSDEEVVYDEK